MDIENVLEKENIKIHILYNDNKEPLFKGKDIGTILGLTNIHSTAEKFNIEKLYLKTNTRGGPQTMLYITLKGLEKIICKSRKPKAIELAKLLNINISHSFYIPLETSIVHFIQNVYKTTRTYSANLNAKILKLISCFERLVALFLSFFHKGSFIPRNTLFNLRAKVWERYS